jgi:D-arabinose 1-dehydrogenase-like Zn-dependent alcohol dehydrogenase
LKSLFARYGKPARITWVSKFPPPREVAGPNTKSADVSALADASCDDVIYFGSTPETVEALFPKVAGNGLLNIVLCGGRFSRDVVTMVGRIHYGGIRIVGTTGSDPAESMEIIPQTDEIRPGDKINIIGAGGPMGMMHVIRNICQGAEHAGAAVRAQASRAGREGAMSVYASDVDNSRLAALTKIAAPLAAKNGVRYKTFNPTKEKTAETFDYTALMAPVPALVAASVHGAAKRGLINIFAGIPATVTGEIDLNAYIEKRLYFIGTSGSTLEDMKRMLAKVESGQLDTNVSVAAISGLEGATDGIRAVENRTIAGKIIVYPACRNMGLVPLEELRLRMPEVAECLHEGLWTKQAEEKLLENYSG